MFGDLLYRYPVLGRSGSGSGASIDAGVVPDAGHDTANAAQDDTVTNFEVHSIGFALSHDKLTDRVAELEAENRGLKDGNARKDARYEVLVQQHRMAGRFKLSLEDESKKGLRRKLLEMADAL